MDSFRLNEWKRMELLAFLSSAGAKRWITYYNKNSSINLKNNHYWFLECLDCAEGFFFFFFKPIRVYTEIPNLIPESVLEKRAALMSLSKALQALLLACSGNFPLKSSRHSRASAKYFSSNRHLASLKWAFRCPGFRVRAFRQSLRAS